MAGNRLARREISDYDCDQRADRRGQNAEHESVLQCELGRRELEEHEMDVVEGEVAERDELRREFRERGGEEGEIGQKDWIEQHDESQGERDPLQPAEPDEPRVALLAPDDRVAAPAENDMLGAQ